MRYKKIVFITILSATLIYACSKTVLEKRPLGSLDEIEIANKDGVEGLLIGAYSLLDGEGGNKSDFGTSGSNWPFGSVCGSEAYKGGTSLDDQHDILDFETFQTNATNKTNEAKWATLYDGVQRCNDVIRVMRKATNIKKEDTIEIKAEALFLRAFYHFEAKKIWDKVPFVDESITYAAGNYKIGNEPTIWPFIENDLRFAAENLPPSQDEVGRANHYTALALLAKVYIFQHKFDDAKDLLNEIINSNKYALEENYADNFNPATQNNTESIFAAQNSVNDDSQGGNGNYGDVLNFPTNGGPGQCCGFFRPSQYFVNHFKTDSSTGLPDLDHYNDSDITNDEGIHSDQQFTPYQGTLDPRLDWSIGRRGIPYFDWGNHPGYNWTSVQEVFGPYNPKKNAFYKSQLGELTDKSFWTSGATANNINLIRYADVLLWAAEAETESSTGSLDKARDYVNQIRARAANAAGWVYKYKDDLDPALGFSDTPAAKYYVKLYTNPWTHDEAIKAIRYERMLELGMEGHRFFDLVRWGIAAQDINGYLDKEKISRTYLSNAKFKQGKNEYFPIPQDEIDKSDHRLKQNPGY